MLNEYRAVTCLKSKPTALFILLRLNDSANNSKLPLVILRNAVIDASSFVRYNIDRSRARDTSFYRRNKNEIDDR